MTKAGWIIAGQHLLIAALWLLATAFVVATAGLMLMVVAGAVATF
jgi:hypothetical protein